MVADRLLTTRARVVRESRCWYLAFPTLASARAFYDRAECVAARGKRAGAAEMGMIAVAGV
jgi:uncharacterized protein (DUF1330 family)